MYVKRWRRLVSSLLLVCLLLGSGGFLVVDAISDYWPALTKWFLGSDNISVISGGTAFDLTGSTPGNKGIAVCQISVPSGKSYHLTGKFSFARRGTTAKAVFSYLTENGDEVILWQGAVGIDNVNVDTTINLRSDQSAIGFSVYIETGGVVTLRDFSLVDDSTDTGILNSIKEGFQKLWEWLQGIWDSIKEIPTKIAASLTSLGDRIKDFFSSLGDRIGNFFSDLWERIKAFFLPSEGFFDEYSAKFNVFIDSHFGFLADLPDELSILFSTFINYRPSDVPSLQIPEVVVPIPGHPIKLLEAQTYTFDLLAQSPYSMLYSFYKAFVWFAYSLMLFNLLRRKYAVVFGGASDAD